MSMRALKTRFLRSPVVSTIPIPDPAADELLIKVAYVSLNPTDYKHAAVALPPSKVIGCDFSGTIERIGAGVKDPSFTVGARVAGAVHGCHSPRTGAFAEYLVTDAELCYKVPDEVPLENACTLTVGWVSALQALEQRLYHGYTEEEDGDTLLVYSAATVTGLYIVQQARLMFPKTFIIALASPQHNDLLRKMGANEVFDYRAPSLVDDVRSLGRDIRRGVDCFSEGQSSALAARCMISSEEEKSSGAKPGMPRRLIRTLPPAMIKGSIPPNVQTDEWILSYTAFGKPFWFLFKHYPSKPEDHKIASTYLKRLTGLLQEGKVTPVTPHLMPGGLESIEKGFADLKAGKVRGEKLVYKVC